jgi:hypothetical protein
VLGRVKAGELSASPLDGLRITWTVAWPVNRSLNVAGRLMLETVRQTAQRLVENGTWTLAEFAPDSRAATRKRHGSRRT